ncbi:MAG: HAD family hydrolase [Anaerolineaceae bacterium]
MPLDIARIRALCFDVDGTLSDTDNHAVHVISQRLAFVRWLFHQKDPHAFARWLVMSVETPGNFIYGIPDRLGFDTALARLSDQIARLGWGRKPENFWLIPKTHELLEKLHPHFPMSVVSARNQKGTLLFLNQFNLLPFFHSVITAHTCEHTKPFPDPILWAAQQMDVSPEACLMIGDTTVDIRAGKLAGAQTVGVLCGFGTERELRRAGADLILPDTSHLAEVLLNTDPSDPISQQ